jgi:endoribonuclease Nob1
VKRVLDASAFLSGLQFVGELYTVPSVLAELRRHEFTPTLEAFLATHVRVFSPDPGVVAKIRSASERTGDDPRISPTDRDLLALALELGATLITDDYSIQNVAQSLGIPYEAALAPGIREQWQWSYRCTACGATWPEWHEECPTCGRPLRTARAPATGGRQSERGR